jgi:glycine/D-amino acid oxidase-like deaminating enzyme
VPQGASTRNAGFACIGSISEHLADIQKAGEETVLNRVKRRWKGLKLLRETLGDKQIDYQPTGGYDIFPEKERFDACREHIDRFNRLFEEAIGEKEVYSVDSVNGMDAIFNRLDGALNSGKLIRELHRKLAGLGVRVWWNSTVSEVSAENVVIDGGPVLHPKRTVLAVNGFASKLSQLPVKPARGSVLVTKPVEKLAWRGTFNYNGGYVYFRNVGDRLLLGGGRNIAVEEETTDQFEINPAIRDYLTDFADEVLKLPAGWETEMEWSGIMGMTENKEPVVRQLEPGVWAAAGLSGMGIAIGMQVGREVVEKM